MVIKDRSKCQPGKETPPFVSLTSPSLNEAKGNICRARFDAYLFSLCLTLWAQEYCWHETEVVIMKWNKGQEVTILQSGALWFTLKLWAGGRREELGTLLSILSSVQGSPPTTASLLGLHLPPPQSSSLQPWQDSKIRVLFVLFFTCYSLERGLGSPLPDFLTPACWASVWRSFYLYLYLGFIKLLWIPTDSRLGRSVAQVLQEPTAAVQQE